MQDSPRLTLLVLDPVEEWQASGHVAETSRPVDQGAGQVAPSLSGRARLVCEEAGTGTAGECRVYGSPGGEWITKCRRAFSVRSSTKRTAPKLRPGSGTRRRRPRDEVWAGYRFVALGDAQAGSVLKVIDLGAGHSSGSENAMRTCHRRIEVRGPAQRVRRRGLRRPPLAARVQGNGSLAAHRPAPELSQRRVDQAAGPGRGPSTADRRVRGARRLRAGLRRTGWYANIKECGTTSRLGRRRWPSNPASSF